MKLALLENTENVFIQRRHSFRVRLLFPVLVRQVGELKASDEDEFKLVGKNISGDGLLLWIPKHECKLSAGEQLKLRMKLPIGEIEAIGEIVWMSELDEGYNAGVAFREIAGADRERIIKLCFEIHRKMLRRGFRE